MPTRSASGIAIQSIMKIAITDIETGGLSFRKHEILEIGLIVVDLDTMEIVDTFEAKVRPERPLDIDSRAAAVNGYNEAEWEDAMTPYQAISMYTEKARGCTFLAHNNIFDYGFLDQMAHDTGVPLPFTRHRLDLLTLAWGELRGITDKLSLKALCGILGLPEEPERHSALEGAMAAYRVFGALMELRDRNKK